MIEKYKTILKSNQAEIVEKKSKFIGTSMPIESEVEAEEFINSMRKKYYDATHNVFAYQLGERNELQRSSDDGEPSGTAGKPILDILKNEDIKNVAVVVTRYFGGTLLGTGGLVRTYSKCAKDALISSQIIEKVLYQEFEISVDYNLSGKVQFEMLNKNYTIKDTLYTDKVTFIVLVEIKYKEQFQNFITEITSAQAQINPKSISYYIWIDGKLQIN